MDRSVKLAVRPPGHAEGTLKRGRHSRRLKTSAAHRSAAMAGGARPDPFRTRKLSRRAPMVLRGQPVGEQGAADRWTALDPYAAGSGAGAPRGHPLRRPLFSPYRSAEGPPGPFFMPREYGAEGRTPRPPVRGPDGIIRIGSGGRTAPSPRRPPLPPGPFSPARGRSPRRGPGGRARGPGGLRPHAAPDGPPVHGGGAPGSAPSGGRSARRWRSRRHPARASLPSPDRAGRTGPRGASCGHREGPAVQLPGAGPASMSPSRLKRNRRIIPRAPAPLREWACGPSRLRSFERSSTWRFTYGLLAFRGARRGHGPLSAIQICVRNVETDIPGPGRPALWHY